MYAFDAYQYDVDVFVSDKAFIRHNKILSDHPLSGAEIANQTTGEWKRLSVRCTYRGITIEEYMICNGIYKFG